MREKKAYHGFRVEKVEIGNENIITASAGRCAFTYSYTASKIPEEFTVCLDALDREDFDSIYLNPDMSA